MRIALLVTVIVLVLAIIGRSRREVAENSARSMATAEAQVAPNTKEISEKDYGSLWPFVRLRAVIECLSTKAGEIPVVELGSKRYAFTGSTSALLRIPTLADAEWLDRGDAGFGKIDLTPLRDDAFRFCGTPNGPYSPVKE